ncbi:catechol 2,3-dioxygenase-like lactoylglutathione lyase family enzyme [Pseudomonas psychrotolerans]|nr:catechol 2,3-dioxygenase-like lactoylglutathione lyase family enzyme [Pseudomonas psychrotolerans]
MLDHLFLAVADLPRALAFYSAALTPLGIHDRLDYDGRQGPPGHPDLKGFGAHGRMFFWLRQGPAAGPATHIGFVARKPRGGRRRPRRRPGSGRSRTEPAGRAPALRPALLRRQRRRPGRPHPGVRL